jgi:hypothetical protein
MQLRRTKFLFTKACSFAAVRKTTEDKIGNNFYYDSKKIACNHCLGIIILYSTELLSISGRCVTVSAYFFLFLTQAALCKPGWVLLVSKRRKFSVIPYIQPSMCVNFFIIFEDIRRKILSGLECGVNNADVRI